MRRVDGLARGKCLLGRRQGHLVCGERLVVFAHFEEDRAEVVIGREERAINLDRGAIGRDRVLVTTELVVGIPQVELRARVLRIQLDRRLERLDRLGGAVEAPQHRAVQVMRGRILPREPDSPGDVRERRLGLTELQFQSAGIKQQRRIGRRSLQSGRKSWSASCSFPCL